MKRILLLFAVFGTFFGTMAAQKTEATPKTKSALLIGYATSFKDSVVYLTTAQSLPVADIKNGAEARAPYTLQWTSYMNARADVQHPVCVLFQVEKEKEAGKQLARLKRRATKEGFKRIVEVQPDEFSFLVVTPTPATPNTSPQETSEPVTNSEQP